MRYCSHMKSGLAIIALVALGCAGRTRPATNPLSNRCELSIFNRTVHALDIRVGHWLTSYSIGAVNTGEKVSHAVSCAEGGVWITGVAIPTSVGAPVRFHSVQDWVDVFPGERANLSLHWP
jgi:hypothetical protein